MPTGMRRMVWVRGLVRYPLRIGDETSRYANGVEHGPYYLTDLSLLDDPRKDWQGR